MLTAADYLCLLLVGCLLPAGDPLPLAVGCWLPVDCPRACSSSCHCHRLPAAYTVNCPVHHDVSIFVEPLVVKLLDTATFDRFLHFAFCDGAVAAGCVECPLPGCTNAPFWPDLIGVLPCAHSRPMRADVVALWIGSVHWGRQKWKVEQGFCPPPPPPYCSHQFASSIIPAPF